MASRQTVTLLPAGHSAEALLHWKHAYWKCGVESFPTPQGQASEASSRTKIPLQNFSSPIHMCLSQGNQQLG